METKVESGLEIREAVPTDIHLISSFIKEIAEYEKLSHEVVATEEMLKGSIFGNNSNVKVLLAFYNNEPAGYAVYFYNFSTFMGKRGLYLEDLFVKPHLRKKGIGKRLLIKLAQVAIEENCGRFEWAVLDWNTPSIEFYKRLGAVPMDEWTIFRISGKALEDLANKKGS